MDPMDLFFASLIIIFVLAVFAFSSYKLVMMIKKAINKESFKNNKKLLKKSKNKV